MMVLRRAVKKECVQQRQADIQQILRLVAELVKQLLVQNGMLKKVNVFKHAILYKYPLE